MEGENVRERTRRAMRAKARGKLIRAGESGKESKMARGSENLEEAE